MTTVQFTPVAKLNVGEIVSTGAGTRQTIVKVEAQSVARRPVLRITFEDSSGYQSYGFYRSDEEMLVEK